MRRLYTNGYSLSKECNHYYSEDYIEEIMDKLQFNKSFPVIYWDKSHVAIYDLLDFCNSFGALQCIIVAEIPLFMVHDKDGNYHVDEEWQMIEIKRFVDIGFVDISKYMNPYDINCFIYSNIYGNKILDYIIKGECNKMEKFKCPVYVTYENSIRPNVTGVYLSKSQTEKERDKRDDLEIIDTFELQGNSARDDWGSKVYDECNYYNPRIPMIRTLISALYDIEGCVCGGIAHIVTDDDNFEDHHLQFVIDECNKEENKDRLEIGLAKLICEELLKLNMRERALLFSGYYSYACDGNCSECCIDKGELR